MVSGTQPTASFASAIHSRLMKTGRLTDDVVEAVDGISCNDVPGRSAAPFPARFGHCSNFVEFGVYLTHLQFVLLNELPVGIGFS